MVMKISTASDDSTSYTVTPEDTEHLIPEALGQYYEDIALSLIKMGPDHYLKFYFNEGDIYAHSNGRNFSITGLKIESCPSILKEILGEDIPLDSILNRGDHLKLGGQYLRFFRLQDFPQEIADHGHFDSLGHYFMTVRQVPQTRSCALLDRKRKVFRSDNTGEFSNYKSEEGEMQAEELLSQIQLGTECLLEIEFWFWVLANTEDSLNEQTQYLINFFKHSDGKIKIEDLGLSEAFLNFVPGHPPSFIQAEFFPTRYALGLMPLSGDYLHKDGMKLHSLGDRPIFFNNFSGANYNLAIVGHSGSGKTFLAQKIVDYHLSKGLKTLILDRGDSFDRLAKYHEGTILGRKINPLQFKNAKFLAEFLSSFIPDGEISYQKKCLLFKAVRDHLHSIKNLDDLFRCIDKKIKNFSLYFEEHREFFTDTPTEITDITYVNTRNYPESFLRPLFIYLTEYVKHLSGQKVFVFEECWHALHHNINYIGEFFRTSRAQGISCMAITQRFDDLLASDLGKIIAENTYFQILFSAPQRENEYLDSNDLESIAALSSQKGQYSEFYIKTPFQRKTLRFYPTCLEHERFTSHFEDRKAINRFIKEYKDHFDHKTLIHRWTELKHGKDIHNFLAYPKDGPELNTVCPR